MMSMYVASDLSLPHSLGNLILIYLLFVTFSQYFSVPIIFILQNCKVQYDVASCKQVAYGMTEDSVECLPLNKYFLNTGDALVGTGAQQMKAGGSPCVSAACYTARRL